MSEGSVEGVLLVDKPTGPTSHDVVSMVRRATGVRRVGHTGTLDPFASGLLLILIGRATRLAEYFSGFSKTYLATARLGVSTESDDPEGAVLSSSESWQDLTHSRIEEVLRSFEGLSKQRPPAFSAKKVEGTAAYEHARRGEPVELEAVPVTVHEIALEEVALPTLCFRVECSTGTYVRAIARDLGERLGCGAHLTDLRRVAIGPFDVAGAVDAAGEMALDLVRAALITPLDALPHLPRIDVSRDLADRIRSGQRIPLEQVGVTAAPEDRAEAEIAIVAFDGDLIAVASVAGDRIQPRKVFPVE